MSDGLAYPRPHPTYYRTAIYNIYNSDEEETTNYRTLVLNNLSLQLMCRHPDKNSMKGNNSNEKQGKKIKGHYFAKVAFISGHDDSLQHFEF